MSDRLRVLTAKVPAEATGLIGALYVHAELDGEGRAVSLAISSPGKLADSAMETVLQAVAAAATELLGGAGESA